MKLISLVAVMVAMLCGCVSAENRNGSFRAGTYGGRSDGRSVRYYKPNGGYAGRSVSNGSVTREYGSNGAYRGRSDYSGNTARHYDAKGKLIGTSRK